MSVTGGPLLGRSRRVADAQPLRLQQPADDAKIALAYTKAGLTPDGGLSWVLSRRLTWPRIADLMLANRMITGAEAV